MSFFLINKTYLLLGCVIHLSTVCCYGLTVDAVDGNYKHKNTVVIRGHEFGAKAAPLPSVWDDFEDGDCNTTATIGTWQGIYKLTAAQTNKRNVSSNYSGYYNFIDTGTAGVQSSRNILSRKWFVQYWVYLGNNWDWGTFSSGNNGEKFLDNVKFLRFWNPDTGGVNENFYTQFWWGINENSYSYTENITGQSPKDYGTNFSKSSLVKGVWHCMQFEFLDSSSKNIADAEFRMWFDGRLMENRSGFICKEDYAEAKRVAHAGFYNAWWGNGPVGDNDFFMDDIYIDVTWSRVEIGNNQSFLNCTHREIQIPTAWTNTEIKIQFNQGSFQDGEQAYLFVIDADGNASEGFPITIGESTTDTVGPVVTNQVPAAGAVNVAPDTTISFNLTDSGSGVNQDSIKLSVECSEVTTFTKADQGAAWIAVSYTPSQNFDYGQTVDIAIDASDLAATPNAMTQATYSFKIEMPSDVNEDGVVDNTDVGIVRDKTIGLAKELTYNADVNVDTSVNSLDAQKVVNDRQ